MKAATLLKTSTWQPQSEFLRRLDATSRAEGQRALLRRMLKKRVGDLPEALDDRIEHATEVELGRWGEELVVASSLDEVFGA